jgi:predicted XRE-type DNA-binding protein
VVRDEHGPRHVTPAGRSVFYDLFPKAEADELVMRSTLLRGLEHWLKESGLTQTQAAKALDITHKPECPISSAAKSGSLAWIC